MHDFLPALLRHIRLPLVFFGLFHRDAMMSFDTALLYIRRVARIESIRPLWALTMAALIHYPFAPPSRMKYFEAFFFGLMPLLMLSAEGPIFRVMRSSPGFLAMPVMNVAAQHRYRRSGVMLASSARSCASRQGWLSGLVYRLLSSVIRLSRLTFSQSLRPRSAPPRSWLPSDGCFRCARRDSASQVSHPPLILISASFEAIFLGGQALIGAPYFPWLALVALSAAV